MEPQNDSNRNIFIIKSFLKDYLDLRRDKENEQATVDAIRRGVEFKGAALWILILAVFMASLGLNVNSTAVIIGAMLISPLMGPIMGIGLSVGINDFELMKRSLKSYVVTTAFCVVTATIFFAISPVAEGQSELLARTSPTIYDVFIALLGGLAGVIALSITEKGYVIPGVAIATALMPPLCTAGYGLATGNLIYFLGAFYLYFINSVFISLATFLGVRAFHFSRKALADKKREKAVRRYIVIIAVVTMIPAIYLTVGIVQNMMFETNATRFIREQLSFENTQILDKDISNTTSGRQIRVVLIGQEVPEASLALARDRMADYKLGDCQLTVLQGANNEELDISSIRAMVMEDFYKNSEQKLVAQRQQIESLEQSLERYTRMDEVGQAIVPELRVLYPQVKAVSLSHAIEHAIGADDDTAAILGAEANAAPSAGTAAATAAEANGPSPATPTAEQTDAASTSASDGATTSAGTGAEPGGEPAAEGVADSLAVASSRADTVTLAVVLLDQKLKADEQEKLTQWLKARTGSARLRLIPIQVED